ncbi:MAG: ribosome rescue protein RqcH [Candidatus Bathyarchaeia archaeon]
MRSKGSLTSFDVHVLARELDVELRGYYIGKIYQVNASTMLLKLNKPGSTQRLLVLEAGRRLNLTTYDIARPDYPSQFCSALRKYLLNGSIQRVEQPSFERIVSFTISRGSTSYSLIAEVFPPGNIILLDSQGVILHALRYRKMRDRDLIRGSKYAAPPSTGLDPRLATLTQVKSLREQNTETVKALTRTFAVGGPYAEELLAAAGIDKHTPASKLTDEQLKTLHSAMEEIVRKLDNTQPRLVLSADGSPLTVASFPFVTHEGYAFRTFQSHNEAVDELFSYITSVEETEKQRSGVLEETEKFSRILQEQSLKEEALRKELETKKPIGAVIHRNSTQLSRLLSQIGAWIEAGKSPAEISREAATTSPPGVEFRSFNPAEKKITVNVEGSEFTLSLRKSVFQNASDYFDEVKKLKEKLSSVMKVSEEISSRRKSTQRQLEGVKVKPASKTREKKWYEKYSSFTSSEGFLVVAGRDATSNEAVLKRYGEPADIAFHADIPGAAFVLIKTGGRTPGEATLTEAAQFAAVHSRAWREELAATDVYWVKHTQLSKQAPAGEYLPRGAFMVYGERNYVHRVPLRLAVGVTIGEDLTITAGPPSAVRKQTPYLVELTPGSQSAKDLAIRMKQTLVQMVPKEHSKRILGTSLQELMGLIPFGRGHLAGRWDQTA